MAMRASLECSDGSRTHVLEHASPSERGAIYHLYERSPHNLTSGGTKNTL